MSGSLTFVELLSSKSQGAKSGKKNLTIYCDNTNAINISKNLVQHSSTKHIKIRHQFIRELVEDGTLTLEFIHIDDQKADLFTKPLDSKCFEFLRQNIGVISMSDPSSFSSFLMHLHLVLCFVCFFMFLFGWFSVCFILLFIKIKIKIEKYKNSVCLCILVLVYPKWLFVGF